MHQYQNDRIVCLTLLFSNSYKPLNYYDSGLWGLRRYGGVFTQPQSKSVISQAFVMAAFGQLQAYVVTGCHDHALIACHILLRQNYR